MNNNDIYVDGFVMTVAKDKLDDYKKMASEAGKTRMKHGALQYVECVGDDMYPDMKGYDVPRFPELLGNSENDLVVFSFIVFSSREHRDEVNAKVMSDPDMNSGTEETKDMVMPFDMAKMLYAGFRSFVNYQK